MAKEKMSIDKKNRLVYSLEMILFAVAFIVIATLEILNIIGKREVMLIIFNWVTIFGGVWMIVDFFWVMFSPKRRAKNSLLDKAMLIPLGIYFITFDLICFCQLDFVTLEFRRRMMAIGFYYVGAVYLFQGIYHYFYPIRLIKLAIAEEEALAKEKEEAANAEENKEENKLEE